MKLCECGCGGQTRFVDGQQRRFIHGHNAAKSLEERFWTKVDRTSSCWLWTASLLPWGYGSFYFNGKTVRAHRFAYEWLVGPIPEGLQLDHLCRNPKCVNPDHLEPVTNRENVLRGEGAPARNIWVTHCPKGHPYDAVNTYRNRNGSRRCRACAHDYDVRNREFRRQAQQRRRDARKAAATDVADLSDEWGRR